MLESLKDANSFSEMCEKLSEFLGMDSAVPPAIMRRALEDEKFAFHLANCRKHPELLKILFADPKNGNYEAGRDSKPTATLLTQAAKALIKWGKAGFHKVDQRIYERRLAACNACPNLVEPSQQIVYRILSSTGKENDRRICNACGCVASRKASISTEECPLADPRNPRVSRWGEPMQQA